MSNYDADECDHDSPPMQPPSYSLQILDLIGIVAQTTGGVLATTGNGFMAVAQEFYAAARLRRIRDEQRRQREVEGLTLERLVNGDA